MKTDHFKYSKRICKSKPQRGVCVCISVCMCLCMHVVCRNAIRIFLFAPKHNRTRHIQIQRHYSFQQCAYIRINAQMCVTSAFHAARNSHSFNMPTISFWFSTSRHSVEMCTCVKKLRPMNSFSGLSFELGSIVCDDF